MVIDIEESKKQGKTVYRDTVVQKEEPKKAEKKSKKTDDSETVSFRDED